MKLTIDIPDNKADFMLELLHSMPFVSVVQDRRARRAAQKAELMAHVQDAVNELNEVLAGRKEARDAYELLAELDAIYDQDPK